MFQLAGPLRTSKPSPVSPANTRNPTAPISAE